MRKIFYGLLIILAFFSCRKKNKWDVDVSKIPAQVQIVRFDTMFYAKPVENFSKLKKEFPYLFSPEIPDSVWQKKMQDTLFIHLSREVQRVFPKNLGVENDLENLFKHIKYYFPKWKEPKIITLYSDWDYMKRVFLTDTLAFLFIDNYLGKDNSVYEGIPQYIRHTMDKHYIPVDFSRRTAEYLIKPPQTKDFLSKMVYQGKIIFLQKAFMPQVHDSLLFGYTTEKWKWAVENEKNVWLYFLDNQLLYKSDKKLNMRFLDPSPFSKFYTEFDNQSAGMIGRYIGYQIVKSYMKKTGSDIKNLLRINEHELFNQSKYKP